MMTHEIAKNKNWAVGIDYPEWGNNELYLQTITNGYLFGEETPKQAYTRVSNKAAELLNRPDLKREFFDVLWKGWLCLSSPVLANFGLKRGLPISCFNSYYSDDMYEINRKNLEIAMMSKNGGGTSANVSAIRHNGAAISSGGTTDGQIPFLKQLDSTVKASKQFPVRRGACAVYNEITHKDYRDFLMINEGMGDPDRFQMKLSQGAIISDEFMNSLETNQENKKLWIETLMRRVKRGQPYLMFKDNANNQKWWEGILNIPEINSSNLCVTPETQILTDEGYIEIGKNEGRKVNVWNGEQWSKTIILKTGVNQKVITVNFDNGSSINCTEYHKFYVENGGIKLSIQKDNEGFKNNLVSEVKAKDLKVGDIIEGYVFENKVYSGVKVTSIIDNGKYSDTYCVTEPIRNKVVFNGILTGNCNEIYLPTDKDHSFVCCLSSLNLTKYEEWKNTNLVELAIYFLDAVMEEFIIKARQIKGLDDAVRFAEKSRALGLGVLGYCSFLQSKMIPFESIEANAWNKIIFKDIHEKGLIATKKLAQEYGEPEWLKRTGRRNLTLEAIAPTVSNAKLSGGLSQGIEPYESNIFTDNDSKGSYVIKNKYLEALLESKGKNTSEVWDKINEDKGSVYNLDFLTNEEKAVFKTAREINQMEIVNQDAIRQQYIEQGQSLNLFFAYDAPAKFINDVHIKAWKSGLKGLYYFRSQSALNSTISNVYSDCISCEG